MNNYNFLIIAYEPNRGLQAQSTRLPAPAGGSASGMTSRPALAGWVFGQQHYKVKRLGSRALHWFTLIVHYKLRFAFPYPSKIRSMVHPSANR